MTTAEAEIIVKELCAAYPSARLTAENKAAYVNAIVRLPAAQTHRAIREVAYSQERFPGVAHLLHLIRDAEATQQGERPATYTGRATLKVSDACIHCSRRITDQEFEDGNWAFVENGAGEVCGREHRRCYPKAQSEAAAPDRRAERAETAPEPVAVAMEIPF